MIKRLLVLLICCACLSSTYAESTPYFHTVKTMPGDGVFSLLRRYKVNPSECNLNKFYEINELDVNELLKSDQEYKIPVFIYEYNGTSIRSTLKIDDWATAVNIKEYNEYLKAKKLRQTNYTDSKILWVPYSSLHCNEKVAMKTEISAVETSVKQEAVDAPTGATRFVPLFGKKEGNVHIVDQKLKNKVFYLVSGHGGPDPGTRCTTCAETMCEDEYAYDVVLRLAKNLMQHGALVHVIIKDHNDGIRDAHYLDCDKDEVCLDNLTIPLKQQARLVQRTVAINNLYNKYAAKGIKEQTAVIVHVDSRDNVKQSVDTYFMHAKNSKSGKKLANDLKKTFKKKYEKYQKGRGYKGSVTQRNWFLLNNTIPPAVYIELGNIKNKRDQDRIKYVENRQALANWMFEGLTKIQN